MANNQFKPSYYQNSAGRDVIATYIDEYGTEAFEYVAVFNVKKYLARAGKKPGEDKAKDYGKALEYLTRLVNTLREDDEKKKN